MRLLKNVRLLRNGHTHHRENLARRCILDDHSHEPSQPSYFNTRMSGPRQSLEVA